MHYPSLRKGTGLFIQYDDGQSPAFPEQTYDREFKCYIGYVTVSEAVKYIRSGRAFIAIECDSSRHDLREGLKDLLKRDSYAGMSWDEKLLRAWHERGDFAILADDGATSPEDVDSTGACVECHDGTPMLLHLVPIEYRAALYHVISTDGNTIVPTLNEEQMPSLHLATVKPFYSSHSWQQRVMWQISPSQETCKKCHAHAGNQPMATAGAVAWEDIAPVFPSEKVARMSSTRDELDDIQRPELEIQRAEQQTILTHEGKRRKPQTMSEKQGSLTALFEDFHRSLTALFEDFHLTEDVDNDQSGALSMIANVEMIAHRSLDD